MCASPTGGVSATCSSHGSEEEHSRSVIPFPCFPHAARPLSVPRVRKQCWSRCRLFLISSGSQPETLLSVQSGENVESDPAALEAGRGRHADTPSRFLGHHPPSPRLPTGGCKSTRGSIIKKKKLAKFTFPLLSSFNNHQNELLCLLRTLHAFRSPVELPSRASPRRDGQGLATSAIVCPFQILTQTWLFL